MQSSTSLRADSAGESLPGFFLYPWYMGKNEVSQVPLGRSQPPASPGSEESPHMMDLGHAVLPDSSAG